MKINEEITIGYSRSRGRKRCCDIERSFVLIQRYSTAERGKYKRLIFIRKKVTDKHSIYYENAFFPVRNSCKIL